MYLAGTFSHLSSWHTGGTILTGCIQCRLDLCPQFCGCKSKQPMYNWSNQGWGLGSGLGFPPPSQIWSASWTVLPCSKPPLFRLPVTLYYPLRWPTQDGTNSSYPGTGTYSCTGPACFWVALWHIFTCFTAYLPHSEASMRDLCWLGMGVRILNMKCHK